jgi:hypothetical protein
VPLGGRSEVGEVAEVAKFVELRNSGICDDLGFGGAVGDEVQIRTFFMAI